MTIDDLKTALHDAIEKGDNRLIRMLYSLVHVYNSDVQDEKPTLHSYEMNDQPQNNDV